MKDCNFRLLAVMVLLGTFYPSNAQKNDTVRESANDQKNSKVTNLRINNIDSLVNLINTLDSKYNEFEISISLTSKGDFVSKETKKLENENFRLSSENKKIEELLIKEKEISTRLEHNSSFYQNQINAFRNSYIKQKNMISNLEAEKQALQAAKDSSWKEMILIRKEADSLHNSVSDLIQANSVLIDSIKISDNNLNNIKNDYDSAKRTFIEQRRADSVSILPVLTIIGEAYSGLPLNLIGNPFSENISGFTGFAGILLKKKMLNGVGTGLNIYNEGKLIPAFQPWNNLEKR